ncbi:MAG: CotH kinase family protein [Gammaproteobacteria bacterium]|nr:CotH kinase family protein [Gammaproteobacteria bacterium]
MNKSHPIFLPVLKTNGTFKSKTILCFLFLSLFALTGCNSSTSSTETPAGSGENIGGDGDPFKRDRLLNINITLSEADYRQLKAEGRTLASTSRECPEQFEYTEFDATVTIDGDVIEKVKVRKKGYLGSLSPTRPSIKLDFNDILKDQSYQHRERMTLNNNRQDPSNARQCLTYDHFRKAGLPAPRCNFAKVTVNGEDLGIFTHIEPIKKPFLNRVFDNKDGNLYEAQLADFGLHLNNRFEKKTNETENDRNDLRLIAEAFQLPDEEFIDLIKSYIDIDEFIKFWAMETLVGHWDSATGNGNNFYIYRSSSDNLFHFIPWGTDASFTGRHLFKPDSGPLYRNFRLASRLYNIEQYRNQYRETLEQYLQDEWDEDQFIESLNQIASFTGTPQENLVSITEFVKGRGAPEDDGYKPSQKVLLTNALENMPDVGKEYLIPDVAPDCSSPVNSDLIVNASIQSDADSGTFQFTLPSGHLVNASITLAAFNVDSAVISEQNNSNPPVVSVLLIGADTNDNYKPYVLQVFIEKPQFANGGFEFHGFASTVLLFNVDDSKPLGVSTLALGDSGEMNLVNVTRTADGSANPYAFDLTIRGKVEFETGENNATNLVNP